MYEIYKITNNVNNKVYIGLTKMGYKKRFKQHEGSPHAIGNAIRKHNIKNFSIKVLECKIETIIEANSIEIYYIAFYDSVKQGYNSTLGGDGKFISEKFRNQVKDGMKNMSQKEKDRIKTLRTEQGKNNNSSAIKVQIFDNFDNLKYETFSNFRKLCKEKDLPSIALEHSYQNNGRPIYTSPYSRTKQKWKKYKNWYAIKI